MRYLLILSTMIIAGLGTFPQSASAQAGEEGTASEPNLQEPAPEEPALQLQLDSAGVEVAPPPPQTSDGYTLEEMETRTRHTKSGSASPLVFFLLV